MPLVPNASKYTVDESGRVFCEGRRVKTHQTPNGIFARLYCDDGEVRSVNVAPLARLGPPPLTLDHIFGTENAKTHPSYPNYALTAYGDIYCVKPPKAGIHANGCYVVPEFLHGPKQTRHVSIRRPDGSRYIVRLAKLVRETWGDKSSFNECE